MTREVVDGVWAIDGWLSWTYLLVDGDELVLVDAGVPWDASTIRAGVRDAGFALGAVDRVLVTHYDLDHVGALARLDDDLDATVYASEVDGRLLTGDRKPPLRGAKAVLTRFVTAPFVDRPNLDVRFVGDGDAVGSFEVFETPGHTPGHVCYVSESLAVGVLGDLARATPGGELRRVPWAFDGNRRRAGRSVREFAARTPAFDVTCVGHGDPLATGGRDELRALATRLE